VSALHVERIDGVPIVHVRADIDAANATRVRQELADCYQRDTDTVVLDLTETTYLDSAGIDMLFRLSERLRQRRSRLVLVIADGSQLQRLGRIVGLDRAMAVHDTVEQALRSLTSRRCEASERS
jgi:anti-anti-sigma factor